MEYNEIDDEENGISFFQILAVLFGRKKILFPVWGGVFILSVIILLFGINPRRRVYSSEFELNLASSEKVYSDGTSINMYELISLNNLTEIGKEIGVTEKTVKKIYYSNGFKIKQVTNVIESETETESAKTESYYIVSFPGNIIKSEEKVRMFIQGIANLPNVKQEEIVTKQLNDQYLKLYTSAKSYDLQIKYLQNQVELIDSRYSSLIATYGDTFLENNKKLSDMKIELDEYYKNNSLEKLAELVKNKGYVKGYENEVTQYQSSIDALMIEKDNNQKKLDDLIDQRDHIIATSGTLNTVELEEYNKNIIDLTIRIRDIDVEVANIQKRIDNINNMTTDPDLIKEISVLESTLREYKGKLDIFTADYTEAAKYVATNNSLSSFKTTFVLETSNEISTIIVLAISLFIGLFVAVVVNLCLDGKKLTRKYKLVHVSMIKEEELQKITKKKQEKDS